MKLVEPFFTDAELSHAAMACRALAHTKRSDAAAQKGSSVAGNAEEEARALDELAARFERMRSAPELPVRIRGATGHACDRKGPRVPVEMEVETCSVCGVPQVFD